MTQEHSGGRVQIFALAVGATVGQTAQGIAQVDDVPRPEAPAADDTAHQDLNPQRLQCNADPSFDGEGLLHMMKPFHHSHDCRTVQRLFNIRIRAGASSLLKSIVFE